jgi:hypothetical protein
VAAAGAAALVADGAADDGSHLKAANVGVSTAIFRPRWSGSAKSHEPGGWPDAVRCSRITLKALTYRPTGGNAASELFFVPGLGSFGPYKTRYLQSHDLETLALLQPLWTNRQRAFYGLPQN